MTEFTEDDFNEVLNTVAKVEEYRALEAAWVSLYRHAPHAWDALDDLEWCMAKRVGGTAEVVRDMLHDKFSWFNPGGDDHDRRVNRSERINHLLRDLSWFLDGEQDDTKERKRLLGLVQELLSG